MGETPKQPLLTQVTELLDGVYGSARHLPSERAPRDAEILGELSQHAKNLYMLRADLWDRLEHIFAAYHEHAAELKARCSESHNLARGILAVVEANRDPEFRQLVERTFELEEQLTASRPLATVVEVLYEQEVREQFPQLGQKEFAIDSRWRVFHMKGSAGPDAIHAIMNALNERHQRS